MAIHANQTFCRAYCVAGSPSRFALRKMPVRPQHFLSTRTAPRSSAQARTSSPELSVAPPRAPAARADGTIIQDDMEAMLRCLPEDIRVPLVTHPDRDLLLEVVLDLGRRPEARFQGQAGGVVLCEREVTREDLLAAEEALGEFGGDNRAGIEGTLHRISAIRNRRGAIVGLTCRVGRTVTGQIDMVRDLLKSPTSLLFLGRPGVGKTTVIRELARVLSEELKKRVVIVDTSNEIGGDGDIPHPAIGTARRMQVPDVAQQHRLMIEAVENHMPEVVIVDEIGTEEEALACRTIAERGVMLIGTAHGQLLENLLKNPTLSDLVGGISSVTLSDEEARARGTQKSVLERTGPPTFPLVIEMRERDHWVTHWVEDSVDSLLHGKCPVVQVRSRDPVTGKAVCTETRYDVGSDSACYDDVATFGEYDEARGGYSVSLPGDQGNPVDLTWYSPGGARMDATRRTAGMSDQDALHELTMLGLNGVGRGPKVYAGAGPGSKLKRSRSARRRN